MRIGHGFDVHAFGSGSSIQLGGITMPSVNMDSLYSGTAVLIHALCDALLGAAALGDIGAHFPDTDPQYENKDSRELLRSVVLLIEDLGFCLQNMDATIIAQAPKMASYIQSMREVLAADLRVKPGQVNIKATTTEHLGTIGRKEGIAVHAVVLLTARQHNE